MYTYVYQKSLSYICNENYYTYSPLRQEADRKHIITVRKLKTTQVYVNQSRINKCIMEYEHNGIIYRKEIELRVQHRYILHINC